MRCLTVMTSFLLSIAAAITGAGASAQASPPAPAGTLLHATVDEVSPDLTVWVGLIRYALSGADTVQVVTGTGPAVYFVEEGTVTVKSLEGATSAQVVQPSELGEMATPQSGDQLTLNAGDGVVLPSGSTTVLAGTSTSPGVLLGLMMAPDAEVKTQVKPSILVSREVTVPEPPLMLRVERIPVAPGGRLAFPEPPAIFVHASVEREDAYLLSGQGFDRGDETLYAYLLTISQA